MFGNLDGEHAREALTALVRTYLAQYKPKHQSKALEVVTSILEQWKSEQADPDGTIEIVPLFLASGLLGDFSTTPRRIPVSTLKPEQCAGPAIRSASDLLLQLSRDQYSGLGAFTASPPLDLAVAVLALRDHRSMPLPSLAWAIHYLWLTTDYERLAYLHALTSDDANRAKQRAHAQKKGVAGNIVRKGRRDDAIDKMGLDYFRANRTAGNADAAAHISKAAKEGQWGDFSNVHKRGIENVLVEKQTKKRALESL